MERNTRPQASAGHVAHRESAHSPGALPSGAAEHRHCAKHPTPKQPTPKHPTKHRMDTSAGPVVLPGRPMAALGMLLAAGSIAFTGSVPLGAPGVEPAGRAAASAPGAVVVPAVSAAGWIPAGEGLARTPRTATAEAGGVAAARGTRGNGTAAARAAVDQALLIGAPAALPGHLLLQHPVASVTITSRFGWRFNPTGSGSQLHIGQDYAMACGSPVRAAEDGTVVQSEWAGHSGQRVAIDHGNGVRTAYSHNSLLLARVGEEVKRGDLIALSGTTGNSTGCHVHFEVYLNGKWVDPALYLPRVPGQPAPLTPREQLAVRDSLDAGSALARPGDDWASAGASGVVAAAAAKAGQSAAGHSASAQAGAGTSGASKTASEKSKAAKKKAAKSKTAEKKGTEKKGTKKPAKASKPPKATKPSGAAGAQDPVVGKPETNVPAAPAPNPVPVPVPVPVPSPAPAPTVPPAEPVVVGGGDSPAAPEPVLPEPPAVPEEQGTVDVPAVPAAEPDAGAGVEENPAALEPIKE